MSRALCPCEVMISHIAVLLKSDLFHLVSRIAPKAHRVFPADAQLAPRLAAIPDSGPADLHDASCQQRAGSCSSRKTSAGPAAAAGRVGPCRLVGDDARFPGLEHLRYNAFEPRRRLDDQSAEERCEGIYAGDAVGSARPRPSRCFAAVVTALLDRPWSRSVL